MKSKINIMEIILIGTAMICVAGFAMVYLKEIIGGFSIILGSVGILAAISFIVWLGLESMH